jgi:hypothetical protein
MTTPLNATPRIVRADGMAEIAITTPGGLSDGAYRVTVYPLEMSAGWGEAVAVAASGGVVRVRQRFGGEQEYLLRVERVEGDTATLLGDVRVYALAPDLFARRPFKGDLHMHSLRSDGKDAPAEVAAACRAIGYDFMALTDHWQYAPSLEAIAAFADAPIALRMYPGEEIHHNAPYCPVHIVNFGGTESVNDRIAADPETYAREVAAIAETLDDPALTPAWRTNYAQCLWTYRRIRAAGGLSIFCHPYWFEGQRWYNVPEPIIARHFADLPFDAYELISGYQLHEVESNLLQVARYHEERAAGVRLPIVGVSDAHGCRTGILFGWYYTLVFAPSLELADLRQSVRDLYSVAVEALPGQTPRAHGPHRLVKYAQYLLRELYPAHDALCAEEGALMHAYLAGDLAAVDALRACRDEAAARWDAVFGV